MWFDDCFLSFKLMIGHDAQRYIRHHGQRMNILSRGIRSSGGASVLDDQRSIMASVAIAQTARRQVENTEEQCYEHHRLVGIRHRLVHQVHDTCRIGLVGRECAEQRLCDCHHQRCRHGFSRHIANAEEQLLIADVEVEQVATHIFRWFQQSVYIYIVAVGIRWEHLRNHRLLYFAGNAQLTTDALLFGINLLQALCLFSHIPYDEGEQGQAKQGQTQHLKARAEQVVIHHLVFGYHCHRPAHTLVNRCKEHVQLLAVLVLQRDIAALAIQHALLNVFSLCVGSLTRDGLHKVARVQQTLVGTHQQLARMR